MRSTKQIDKYLSPSFCFDYVRPFLSGKDLIKFLRLSPTFSKYFIVKAELSLQIPWADYYLDNWPDNPEQGYYGVRDYFIFSHLKELILSIPYTFPYSPIQEKEVEEKKDQRIIKARNILAQTQCAKVLTLKKQSTQACDRKREKKEWERFLLSVKEENQKDLASHISNLESRTKLSLSSPEMQSAINRLNEKTAIVTTFRGNFLAPHESIHNYFELNMDREGYLASRLISEFITICPHVSISELLSLMLVPSLHANYGNLQYIDKLIPTIIFGEDFFVFKEAAKKFATAHYRDMFDICFDHRDRVYSVSLDHPPIALLNQLPDKELSKFLKGDESDVVPIIKWNYFEVQFSSNTHFDLIRHLHLSPVSWANFLIPTYLSKDGQLIKTKKNPLLDDERITISVAKNPFASSEFSTAFIENREHQLIKNQIVKNLECVFRCLGEITEEKYLTCEYTSEALRWIFHITKNSHQFHQASAAAILYLLGVETYFTTHSAIKFTDYSTITHTTPLNGTTKKEGGLADHFALENTKNSLKKLLERTLRFLFGFLVIIPKQNEEYYLKHHLPHPRTGKGATEEEYLTKELFLGRNEKEPFDIAVEWIYDRVMIKVLGCESDFSLIIDQLFSIFGKKKIEAWMSCSFIYIDLTVPEIVKCLTERRICYHATDIFNSRGEIILFPTTKNKGLGSTGGKFHDGDRIYLTGRDYEFGKPKPGIDIAKVREETGIIQDPKTICFGMRDFFIDFEVDPFEFLEEKHSKKRPTSYSLSHSNDLDDHQVDKLASYYGMSFDEYKNNFGNALALSPEHTGSIWVNIRRWQQLFSQELRTQLKDTFNVRINDSYTTVLVNSNKYHLLAPHFCQITIICDWVPFLRKVQDYLSTKKIVSTLQSGELVLAPIEPRWALTLMGVYCEGKYALDYFREHSEFLTDPAKGLLIIHEIYEAFPAEEVAFLCLEDLKQKHSSDVISGILAKGFPDDFVTDINKYLALPTDLQTRNKYILSWMYKRSTLISDPIKIYEQLSGELDSIVDAPLISLFLQDSAFRNALLHTAVDKNHLNLVKLLLEKGADVEARSSDYRSALHLALTKQFKDIAVVLVEHMMKNSSPQPGSPTPQSVVSLEAEAGLESDNCSILHLIFVQDRLPDEQIIFLISKYKHAVNIKDNCGWNLFHLLCSDYCTFEPIKIITLPLEINPMLLESIDPYGLTPLHITVLSYNEIPEDEIGKHSISRTNLVNTLIEKKANVNALTGYFDTPLHFLIGNKYIDLNAKINIAASLIKAGAKIDTKNSFGATPLSLAEKLGDTKLISVLTGKPEVVQSTNSATLFGASKEKKSVPEGPALSL